MKICDIKLSKWYRQICAHNTNKKSRKNKIAPRTRRPKKEKEVRNTFFSKTKDKREEIRRFSVIQSHVRQIYPTIFCIALSFHAFQLDVFALIPPSSLDRLSNNYTDIRSREK